MFLEKLNTNIRIINLSEVHNAPTILITESVYNGLNKDHPSNSMIINKQWNEVIFLDIAGYSGKIYGADLYWPDYKNR
jgi:hypothetical protein